MKEIIIDIDPAGNFIIEAIGFEGRECKDLTKGIEEALGDVTEVREKPEMRQSRAIKRTIGAR